MKKIIVFNVGSSSCKFQIFTENLSSLGKGLVERIGLPKSNILYKDNNGKKISLNKDIVFDELDNFMINFLKDNNVIDFNDVYLMVHRVVNGGDIFTKDIIVDNEQKVKDLLSLNSMAPLHNPFNNSMLISMMKKFPKAKQTVVFDTSFHSTIPKENFLYALPMEMYEKNKIKKYGAHGSSHGFITYQMKKHLNKEKVNIINVHLGNGSSVCVVKESKSLNTSMGFTPLAGLMMGTRSGDVDPSIIFYLINQLGMNPKDVEKMFTKESGLLGVSGISSDMRNLIELSKKGNKQAILTREMFTKRIADFISMYLSEIESFDAITFTGGIGENDKESIKSIIKKLRVKKLSLKNEINNDEDINIISDKDSEIDIYIVPTNEELYMAKIGKALIKG